MAFIQNQFVMEFIPDKNKGVQENFDDIVKALSKYIGDNDYKIRLECLNVKRDDVSDIENYLDEVGQQADLVGKLDLKTPASVDVNGAPLYGLREE